MYSWYKWSQNVDNEVVPCPITVDSHSDLLIFVSVTCMSWISLNTKYQIIGTIVLSVMYYPHVHVVNILQTFQSVIMRSRWTHHTSKYWPCSWCRGELSRNILGSIFCQHKNQRQLQVYATKRSHIVWPNLSIPVKRIQTKHKNIARMQSSISNFSSINLFFPFPKDSIPQFANILPLRNFLKSVCPGLYLG